MYLCIVRYESLLGAKTLAIVLAIEEAKMKHILFTSRSENMREHRKWRDLEKSPVRETEREQAKWRESDNIRERGSKDEQCDAHDEPDM